jgi:hypothetical protein
MSFIGNVGNFGGPGELPLNGLEPYQPPNQVAVYGQELNGAQLVAWAVIMAFFIKNLLGLENNEEPSEAKPFVFETGPALQAVQGVPEIVTIGPVDVAGIPTIDEENKILYILTRQEFINYFYANCMEGSVGGISRDEVANCFRKYISDYNRRKRAPFKK